MVYDESTPPEINREWAESLAQSANSSNGLIVTSETLQGDDVLP